MVLPSPLNDYGVEIALSCHPLRRQQVFCPLPQRSLEPRADWYGKAGFGSLEQRGRRLAIQQLPEDVLADAAANLHLNRNPCGGLGKAMIEERNACFEAGGHRC